MKNLYALTEENELIHIQEVDKKLKKNYTCCNCNGKLIPRKGKVKTHHFSHKAEADCKFETYLHKVSKLKFFEEYSKCLENKEPFYLNYEVLKNCNSCEKIPKINLSCNVGIGVQKFDLTKSFDIIKIEKIHNGFFADIFLKSSKFNQVIFIEFAVTHKCEKEKLNSGIRIIEIELKDQLDLNFITNREIPLNNEKFNFFNFKLQRKKKSYRDPQFCSNSFELFSVSTENNCVKEDICMSEIIQDLKKNKFKFFKILGHQEESDAEKISTLIKDYATTDPKFKNCFSCQFVNQNDGYGGYYNLFCKRLKVKIPNSNHGSDCSKYLRF